MGPISLLLISSACGPVLSVDQSARPAFYTEEGGLFIPGPGRLAGNPWFRDAQNGAAVAALLVQELCSMPTPGPMIVTRLNVDLFREVPRQPLRVRKDVLHDGRKLQILRTALVAEGVDVATATAQRLRVTAGEGEASPPGHSYPSPDEVSPWPIDELTPGIMMHVDQRYIRGGLRRSVPSTGWFRVNIDVIAGRPTEPLAHLLTLCDFGSGISGPYRRDKWTYPNTDISVHLCRAPIGEWFLLDAATESGGNGIAVAHLTLGDRTGIFGRAHQTLLVGRRPEAPAS